MHYYNTNHIPKQFKVREFVKLFTKHLKFKHCKLSSCWIGLFRVLEQIGSQVYYLALPDKYARLHDIFPIQLLETYHRQDDNESLIAMPDLEDPQDKWEVKEVLDCQKIKNMIHYLVKWATWSSEYNFYKPAAHLAKASEAIAAFKQKLKHK
jgi:Chromo (CHRromatin Organisation MOdifier) domain